MSAQMPVTSDVGIISIGVGIYCIFLTILQSFIKHEMSKKILALSYASLLAMSFSSGFIALTYYSPRLWFDDYCFCHPLWSAALISYIASIYLMKSMYMYRFHLIGKDSVLGTPQTKLGIKIAIISLIITFTVCVLSMVFWTDGECHDDGNMYGCTATFRLANIYLTMAMIGYDALLLSALCYKWYKTMQILRATEKNSKVPIEYTQDLIIQFILTIIAVLSCYSDEVIHLMLHNDGYNYHITMIVFLLDVTIVATCNFCGVFASQKLMRNCLCSLCLPWMNRKESKSAAAVNRPRIDTESPSGSSSVPSPTLDSSNVSEEASSQMSSTSNESNQSGVITSMSRSTSASPEVEIAMPHLTVDVTVGSHSQ